MGSPGSDASFPIVPSRSRRRRRRSALRWSAFSLIAAGATLLGYVSYQLWGAGVYTARTQSRMRADIQAHGLPSRPIPGGAVGLIRIPRISLNVAFVQGIDPSDLAKGPGHYSGTPLPGEGGNVVIAGHRTTHLAPFWALDALHPGDQIVLRTRRGTFVYDVRWARVVSPTSWWVVGPTRRPSLTLTTCNPRFSPRQRLVVRAVLVSAALSPAAPSSVHPDRPAPVPS
jgi:sortase A